jgi:hypothetical protein
LPSPRSRRSRRALRPSKFIPEPDDGALAADFATFARDPAALFAGTHNLYRPLHRAGGV